jgi:hypothetical protein
VPASYHAAQPPSLLRDGLVPALLELVFDLIGTQEPSGLWNTGHNRPKGRHSDLWVGFAVCRMLNAIRGNET